MPNFVTSVLWLVLCPLSAVTDITTAVVISHYTPFYHGSDILLFSYAVTMAINSVILPSIPALLEITNNTWSDALCQFYVWIFITFRVLQALTLVALSILWSAIMKYSTRGKKIHFTTLVKGLVPTIWVLSAVVGLLPIIGAVPHTYHADGMCLFLSSDLGPGMAVALGVIVFSCVFLSVICVCDATVLLKYVRRVALVKYGAGRFHLPKKRSGVPGAGTYTIHERYHQLTFAWDVCRLVLIWVVVSSLISHVPYAVLEYVALTSPPGAPRRAIETTVIWLVLIESLCLPHLLWMFSTRYRHAFVYIWRVRVLRKAAEDEEDPAACTLKSYLRTAQHLNGNNRNGPSDNIPQQQVNHGIDTGNRQDNTPLPLADLSTISRQQGQQYQTRLADTHNTRPGTSTSDISPWHQKGVLSSQIRTSGRKSSTLPSVKSHLRVSQSFREPSSSDNLTPYLDPSCIQLERSASSNSRQEWKDQMRKKHLPPIFVNEAFDGGEASRVRIVHRSSSSAHARDDSGSMHFYLSGDYHPDNLNTDSLPRNRHPLEERSESEGISGQYDEADIESILDHSHVTQASVEVHNTRPHLSSFKALQTYNPNTASVLNEKDGESISNTNLPDVISNGLKSIENSDNELDENQEQYDNDLYPLQLEQSEESEESFEDVNVEDLLEDGRNVSDMSRTDGDGDARTDMCKVEEISLDMSYPELSRLEVSTPETRDEVFKIGYSNQQTPVQNNNDGDSFSYIGLSDEKYHHKRPVFERSGRLVSSFHSGPDRHVSHVHSAECHSRGVDSPHSNISTPVSFTFDVDIDRGFEEALSVGCPGTPSICDASPGFDSVTEGSEDGSQAFQVCDTSLEQDPFRTHVVVSKIPSDSGSADNPFENLPSLRYDKRCVASMGMTVSSPVSDMLVRSVLKKDTGDSGFNSGLENSVVVNQESKLADRVMTNSTIPRYQSRSPWPEEEQTADVQHHFEDDFSDGASIDDNRNDFVQSDIESRPNTHGTEPVYF